MFGKQKITTYLCVSLGFMLDPPGTRQVIFGFRKLRQIKHHACGFSSRTLITTGCHLSICIESIFYIQSTNCTLPHVETIMFLPVVTLRCLISLRFQLLWLLYLALYLYESSVMVLKWFFFLFWKISNYISHIFSYACFLMSSWRCYSSSTMQSAS